MTEYDNAIMCENIALLQEKCGFSTKKMAEICGVSPEELMQIEKGILCGITQADLLLRLQAFFGISPGSFIRPFYKAVTNPPPEAPKCIYS